jgi:hypothetical protein
MRRVKFGSVFVLSWAAFFQLLTPLLVAGPVAAPSPDDAMPCPGDAIPHPRVLVTESRLEFLRADMKTNSSRRAIFEKDIKANADRWLKRIITVPEQGGWGHDFCGPDGVLLELPADQQFNPNIPSRSPTTGKKYDSDKIRAARRYFEHVWLTSATRDLALVYAVEQHPEYAGKAAEILLKYTEAYPHFIAGKKGFGFQRFSLGEAVSLIPLAQAYDLIYGSGALNQEQKRRIERAFFWPEAQHLTQSGLNGNWGSWHLSAVGVIGYATGRQRFIDYGLNKFKWQIAGQLGGDGLWPESVHTYHFYPLDGFLSLAEAAANGGDDLFHWQAKPGKGLEAMFDSPLRYMYPTLQLPAINDGWYDAYLPGDQYTVAYRHYRKPEFAWAIRQSEAAGRANDTGTFCDQRYRQFLFGETLPDSIPAPVFKSTNFPVLGIAILRQGSDTPPDREMFLTFHYGPFLGHGHYDKMGATLFACGRPMAPGLGTPGYGSPNIGFFNGVSAHNTVAASRKNQPRTTNSDLVAFLDQPELKLAAAETREAIPGTKWVRAVLLASNYAVVWDKLAGNRAQACDWFFHAAGDKLVLSGATDSRQVDPRRGGEFSQPFMTGARAQESLGNSAQADWFMSGHTGLKMWMLTDTNDLLFTARCPAADGGTMPVVVLRKSGDECEYASVLQPWKGKPGDLQIRADRPDSNTLCLTVIQPTRRDVISFEPARIGFESDAGGPADKKFTMPMSSGK